MAFTERHYQHGLSKLSLFLSCNFAELAIDIGKGSGSLPTIREDLESLAERIGLVSQSLIEIHSSAKEVDIASNVYYGSFSSHFGEVIRLVNFSAPFYHLPFENTRKGGVRWETMPLEPLFSTEHLPVVRDPWNDNTRIGLRKCVSVIEKITAGVLAALNAALQGRRKSSYWTLSEFINPQFYLVTHISRAQLENLAFFFLDQSIIKFPSRIGYKGHNCSVRFSWNGLRDAMRPVYLRFDCPDNATISQNHPRLSKVLMTAASNARPRLEDIEVWHGHTRCYKFTHSLGKLLLRSELEVSFQGRRPKRMIVYLFADRLVIFRAKREALILQLDIHSRRPLFITNTAVENSIYWYVTIYWGENIFAAGCSVKFVKLFLGTAEESNVWESFLAATLLPGARSRSILKMNGDSEHKNTHLITPIAEESSILELDEGEEQRTSIYPQDGHGVAIGDIFKNEA